MDEMYKPTLSRAGRAPTETVTVVDEYGDTREVNVAGEFPLTLKVDDKEVVTLMTLGTHPEELALGYLRNQRLIENIEDVRSIDVDWGAERVDVTTQDRGIIDWEDKLSRKTVTTGCGQGTIFSCTLDKLYGAPLLGAKVHQSTVYRLLSNITAKNKLYKKAGAVHGCALCRLDQVLDFVEDVGRHNAADAISGRMWLERIDGVDKIFYTTGRLTSEIVMKTACMGIPVLVSRSGVTQMGMELAEDLCITMIARAKGKHFLVYTGASNIIFDDIPERKSNNKPDDDLRASKRTRSNGR